jgi:uncharacterized damage-inducible protein DinB
MSAPQPALTPDFAVAQRELMLQGLERELQTTKKVLSAVLDSNRDFRLDPKSRTAWELAWHLASSDVQMLDEIADHKFEMAPRFKQEPRDIADLVNWYETNFMRAANRVRAMTPEQLATPVDFMGVFKMPAVFYLAFVNNHGVHHRGQLAAFLRPMGSKVPSIYGGSADEPWNG